MNRAGTRREKGVRENGTVSKRKKYTHTTFSLPFPHPLTKKKNILFIFFNHWTICFEGGFNRALVFCSSGFGFGGFLVNEGGDGGFTYLDYFFVLFCFFFIYLFILFFSLFIFTYFFIIFFVLFFLGSQKIKIFIFFFRPSPPSVFIYLFFFYFFIFYQFYFTFF